MVTEALTLRSNSKTQKNPQELDANQVTKTKVLNGVILFREISVAKKKKKKRLLEGGGKEWNVKMSVHVQLT